MLLNFELGSGPIKPQVKFKGGRWRDRKQAERGVREPRPRPRARVDTTTASVPSSEEGLMMMAERPNSDRDQERIPEILTVLVTTLRATRDFSRREVANKATARHLAKETAPSFPVSLVSIPHKRPFSKIRNGQRLSRPMRPFLTWPTLALSPSPRDWSRSWAK